MAKLSGVSYEEAMKIYQEQLAQALKYPPVYEFVVTKTQKPSRPKCDVCRVELCQELDAYYGKNPNGKHHCSKCRRIKGIT